MKEIGLSYQDFFGPPVDQRMELKNDLKQRYSKAVDWMNPSMGDSFLNVGVINGLALVDGFSRFPLAKFVESGPIYAFTLMVTAAAIVATAKHQIRANRLNRDIDAFLKSELG